MIDILKRFQKPKPKPGKRDMWTPPPEKTESKFKIWFQNIKVWLYTQMHRLRKPVALPAPKIQPPRPNPKARTPVDFHKLNSLQPNQHPVLPPEYYKEQARLKKTKPYVKEDGTVIHKFFGSGLKIGEIQILSGLTNGLHTLEITPKELIVDNQVREINLGEIDKIRRLVREHLRNNK